MWRQHEVTNTGDRTMMLPFNTDLMKHSSIANTIPTEHEHEAVLAQRKARSATFRIFLKAVFAQVPPHQELKTDVIRG